MRAISARRRRAGRLQKVSESLSRRRKVEVCHGSGLDTRKKWQAKQLADKEQHSLLSAGERRWATPSRTRPILAAHDASGSSALANALRFAAGRNDARADVAADIDLMGRFRPSSLARCVADFERRAILPMRVCGACGARDPSGLCEQQVVLSDLCDDHWLRSLERTGSKLT